MDDPAQLPVLPIEVVSAILSFVQKRSTPWHLVCRLWYAHFVYLRDEKGRFDLNPWDKRALKKACLAGHLPRLKRASRRIHSSLRDTQSREDTQKLHCAALRWAVRAAQNGRGIQFVEHCLLRAGKYPSRAEWVCKESGLFSKFHPETLDLFRELELVRPCWDSGSLIPELELVRPCWDEAVAQGLFGGSLEGACDEAVRWFMREHAPFRGPADEECRRVLWTLARDGHFGLYSEFLPLFQSAAEDVNPSSVALAPQKLLECAAAHGNTAVADKALALGAVLDPATMLRGIRCAGKVFFYLLPRFSFRRVLGFRWWFDLVREACAVPSLRVFEWLTSTPGEAGLRFGIDLYQAAREADPTPMTTLFREAVKNASRAPSGDLLDIIHAIETFSEALGRHPAKKAFKALILDAVKSRWVTSEVVDALLDVAKRLGRHAFDWDHELFTAAVAAKNFSVALYVCQVMEPDAWKCLFPLQDGSRQSRFVVQLFGELGVHDKRLILAAELASHGNLWTLAKILKNVSMPQETRSALEPLCRK